MLTLLAIHASDDDGASWHGLPMMDRQGIRRLPGVQGASDVDACPGVAGAGGLSPPSSVSHAGRP